MTLAEAIVRAKAGEQDGFICLFWHTVPHVWLAAAMLGCSKPGEAVVQIYRDAMASLDSLRSPSDLRVWIGTRAYAVLLRQEEREGTEIPSLSDAAQAAYSLMGKLPRLERLALLVLCGEGCSAPQASEILSQQEIEIKRALRRARQQLSEQMKQAYPAVSCNMNGVLRCSHRCAQNRRRLTRRSCKRCCAVCRPAKPIHSRKLRNSRSQPIMRT